MNFIQFVQTKKHKLSESFFYAFCIGQENSQSVKKKLYSDDEAIKILGYKGERKTQRQTLKNRLKEHPLLEEGKDYFITLNNEETGHSLKYNIQMGYYTIRILSLNRLEIQTYFIELEKLFDEYIEYQLSINEQAKLESEQIISDMKREFAQKIAKLEEEIQILDDELYVEIEPEKSLYISDNRHIKILQNHDNNIKLAVDQFNQKTINHSRDILKNLYEITEAAFYEIKIRRDSQNILTEDWRARFFQIKERKYEQQMKTNAMKELVLMTKLLKNIDKIMEMNTKVPLYLQFCSKIARSLSIKNKDLYPKYDFITNIEKEQKKEALLKYSLFSQLHALFTKEMKQQNEERCDNNVVMIRQEEQWFFSDKITSFDEKISYQKDEERNIKKSQNDNNISHHQFFTEAEDLLISSSPNQNIQNDIEEEAKQFIQLNPKQVFKSNTPKTILKYTLSLSSIFTDPQHANILDSLHKMSFSDLVDGINATKLVSVIKLSIRGLFSVPLFIFQDRISQEFYFDLEHLAFYNAMFNNAKIEDIKHTIGNYRSTFAVDKYFIQVYNRKRTSMSSTTFNYKTFFIKSLIHESKAYYLFFRGRGYLSQWFQQNTTKILNDLREQNIISIYDDIKFNEDYFKQENEKRMTELRQREDKLNKELLLQKREEHDIAMQNYNRLLRKQTKITSSSFKCKIKLIEEAGHESPCFYMIKHEGIRIFDNEPISPEDYSKYQKFKQFKENYKNQNGDKDITFIKAGFTSNFPQRAKQLYEQYNIIEDQDITLFFLYSKKIENLFHDHAKYMSIEQQAGFIPQQYRVSDTESYLDCDEVQNNVKRFMILTENKLYNEVESILDEMLINTVAHAENNIILKRECNMSLSSSLSE